MKKQKKILSKGTLTVLSLLPGSVLAAPPTTVTPIDSTSLTLPQILQQVITYILGFSAAIAVLFLIIGGIRYIASQGNSEATDSAKHTILYAVVGLLVIVLAYVIVTFVGNQLGNTLTGSGGTNVQ